jgi:hypothetical protein
MLQLFQPSPERGRGARAPLFRDVRQVCTVVDDFELTVTHLTEVLGVGPFRCWHFRPPELHDCTFRGRPATYSMKLAITWLDDVQWEVITPVDGPTLYAEFLAKHGRGVQHLLMSTGDVSFEAASAELARRGHPFGQTAALNADVQVGRLKLPSLPNALAGPLCLRFGYVDAEATLRTNIELTRYPLGLSERFSLRSGRAEFCIPAGDARFERSLPNRRVGSLFKVTLVTRDLDATVRAYGELARVGPWRTFERRHAAGFDARVAWSPIGQLLVELVQPQGGAGPYHAFLEGQGEGVFSLGVLPGRDGLDGLVRHLTGAGYAHLLGAPLVGDHPAALLGARRFIGTDLEIVAPGVRRAAELFERTSSDRALS